MQQNSFSLTAHKVAIMRAAHQVLDHPKVFEDPIALRIVGDQGDSEIHAERRKFKTRLHSFLRAIVVARSRFAEDELSAAIKRGVRQYVILGAGLDTLITDLKAMGFAQAENIGPEEINARFFNDRADKLMVGNFGHLMKVQL